MGSLGSLSFLIQASSTLSCSSIHERRTVFCYTRPRFVPVIGRSSLDSSGVARNTSSFGVVKCQIIGGEKEEVGRTDNAEAVVDDARRAIIRQSKEVLARQKKLLKKIEERRELVSSIKPSYVNTQVDAMPFNESVNTEMDAISFNESDSYFLNRNQRSTSGKLDKKYNAYATSEESEQSSQVDISNVNGKSPAEHFLADALGLLREASSETAHIEIMSPSSSTVSKHNLTEEESPVDVKEANVGDSESKQDAAVEEGIKDSPPLAGENVMNVILVAAECAPWSKTGGLGDVAGALPKALARRGHRVMVVVPRYGNYSEPQHLGVYKRYKIDGQDMEVSYYHVYIDGVDYVFVDSPIFWHRGSDIYGGNRVDILKRMILFCKAAVEVPYNVSCGGSCYGDGNLVFIANDWHTALLPVYMKAYYRDHGLMTYARCVLVIHNIAHQGRGPVADFSFLDLPAHYIDLFKFYDPVGGEHSNIFLAGLKTADRVVTVSHGYARELKTLEGGWGLHAIINENDWKFQGIVNGIDTSDWNPTLDVHLKSDGYTNYSVETLQTGKPQCKSALQRELGFPVRDVPIIGFIGRLDHQKGVDIIADAMHWIVGKDVQLVMLGTGRRDLEEMLKRCENQHSDKVRGRVAFSIKMAHRITAGADILLMPSRYEPCGLNQLYAMMYGTAPVVHAVGGLKDTVQQFDPYNETGYGWTFETAEAFRLINALGNCLNTYFHHKTSWEGLQRRGMMQDLSWDRAAQKYEDVLVAAKYQW